MALARVKAYRTGTPEARETDISLLAAVGSDGKPYVLSIDETTGELPVTLSGGVSTVTVKETVYADYAVTSVTTLAWTELIAVTSDVIKSWSVSDGSGEVMELGVGALGAESRFALVQPGGGDIIEHHLAAGSRISIRAVSADATDGYLAINAWS